MFNIFIILISILKNSETETTTDYSTDNDEVSIKSENQVATSSDHFFTLSEPTVLRVERFNTERREYEFSLRNMSDSIDPTDDIEVAFNNAMEKIKSAIDPEDVVGVTISHPDMDKPTFVRYQPVAKITGSMILEQFEKVLQSNQEINLTDKKMILRVTIIKRPKGSGSHNRRGYHTHIEFLQKTCIIRISNADNLCLARAIVTARAQLHKHDPTFLWDRIRKGDKNRETVQKRKAQQLMEIAGLKNHKGPCGLPELKKFSTVMSGYQFKVYSKDMYCAMIFKSTYKILIYIHTLSLLFNNR